MNRQDYRRIKSFSKEEMERWLYYEQIRIQNAVRKQYDDMYHDELDNSIQNFLFAIAYTLHFSDSINLQKDELSSLMDDLFVSVDMFRKGEWKPEDYENALKEDGITFSEYDYSKIYKEKENVYKLVNEDTKKLIEDWIKNNEDKQVTVEDLKLIIDRLEVK